ncbi:MAG: carbohydrate binding domain-containing protein [Bacillota bacterium]
MKKRIIILALVMMFGSFLVSCKPDEPEVVLSSITFSGADDVTLAFDANFNVLTGVTALGNDGVDYTADITYTTTSDVLAGDLLDTTKVGNHAIRYEVRVEDVVAQRWRYITVNAPQGIEGEMLVNPDFALGTAGWDDPSVVYIADGASMTLSIEDGALKAEVVAGSNIWTPRFGQMNVPFEMGKTYEVSYKAKSSVNKTINLQVGELLANDPWFTDFKPSIVVHHDITTEWADYSYKFTMNIDNQRGGVLFELGSIGGVAVDATVWFDDIAVEESTLDVDVSAPTLSGVMETVNVLIGSTYDPATGVTAFDITDGDVTDQIVITIEDSESNPVTTIDTTVETTYIVTYTVEDSLGNSGFLTSTVNVVYLLFSQTNLIKNPSFEAALDETNPEWTVWSESYTVVSGIDTVAGTFELDITGTGPNVYSVQLVQNGYIELEQGKTYRLQFSASATVARTLNVTMGIGLDYDPWYIQYTRQDGIQLTTDEAVYEFVFTVANETHDVKLVFELGNTPGFAEGVVTFYDVALNELDAEPIIMNGDFSDTGWALWSQNWGAAPTVTLGIVDGAYSMTTNLGGDAGWAIQFNQADIALENGKTYTFSFDAMATVARDLNAAIFVPSVYTSYFRQDAIMLTTAMATYSYEFTVAEADHVGLLLSFEMGATASFAAGTITLDNISLKENVVDSPEIIVNGTADQVLYHNFFTEGNGTMSYSDNGAVFAVDTLGGAAYQPHYYYIIDELAAGTYTVIFTMTSSVARDFRFNIILPDAGYASILPDTKYDFSLNADEMTVITVTFTTETMLTNVKVELDFGTLGGELVSEVGTFTLHEIMLYPNY